MRLSIFTDPVLQAPLLGSVLVSICLALVGAIFFLRKESLLGEALSHGAYPGILLGSVLGNGSQFGMLFGGMVSAAIAYAAIFFLKYKKRVSSDLSLLFVLSSFFGMGIIIASKIQFSHPKAYQSIFGYLFGQSALITMDICLLYLLFGLCIILFLSLFFPALQILLFDEGQSKLKNIPTFFLKSTLFLILVVSIVFGIRTVGLILLSGMLIAPVVAARQWTNHLGKLFVLSGLIAAISAFIGALASFSISVNGNYLPLGPSVIFTSVLLAFISLLIAPKRGYLFRWGRIVRFRTKCVRENILKLSFKNSGFFLHELKRKYSSQFWTMRYHLFILQREGFLQYTNNRYQLTSKGISKAKSIVRLHRLWELFLTNQLGIDKADVHSSAEEMEHILTKDLEDRLDILLERPTKDPHEQPIPPSSHA